MVFIEVGALEISASISGKLDSFNRDRRLIGNIYRLILTTCVLGSYINKLIS
jgi:hypothetical protein